MNNDSCLRCPICLEPIPYINAPHKCVKIYVRPDNLPHPAACYEYKKLVELYEENIRRMVTPILCCQCNDHLVHNDGAICEMCAQTLRSDLESCQARNAELLTRISLYEEMIREINRAVDHAAKKLGWHTGSCPCVQYGWEHPEDCEKVCDEMMKGDCWKCWRAWLYELHDEDKDES